MRLVPLALAAFALAPAVLAPAARAQTALTPGHPDLATATPQPYTYDIQIAGPTPRRLGSATHTETVAGGRLTIVNHVVIPARSQDQTDTLVVAWPGMAPVSYASHNGEAHTRVAYAGTRATGRRVLGNLDEAIDVAVPEGVFAQGSASVIARLVPLRAGYTATFRTADSYGYAATDSIRVGEAVGGVWPVTVTSATTGAVTYDVDGATREVRRYAFSPQPNLTVEMVPPPPPPTGAVMRPGDAGLDTSWLTGDAARYTLQLIEPMQMEVGTSTVTRTVEGGVVTSTQTLSVPSQGMNMTQTSRAAAGTLAPISQSMTGQGAAELAFTPSAVTGTKDGAPVSVAFDAPVFDSSWSGEIAQSLPFAEGYTTSIAAYDATNGLSTVTFTVKGQQTVGGVQAWEVEVASPNGPVTYLVDAATRQMVSMRMSPQPGVVVEMRRAE